MYMKKKIMLTTKIDPGLKKEVQKTAAALGMPVGTIVNVLLRQFVRDREINLSLAYDPSPRLIKAIEEGEAEYAAGKLKSYDSLEEMFKDLHKK